MMTTAITANPFTAAIQPPAACVPESLSSGRSASSGITDTSWKSSTAKASRPWRVASCLRSASEAGTRAGEHLRAAEAEYRPAQYPQAARLQLQPDEKKQQHHAELGELQRGLYIADHP